MTKLYTNDTYIDKHNFTQFLVKNLIGSQILQDESKRNGPKLVPIFLDIIPFIGKKNTWNV